MELIEIDTYTLLGIAMISAQRVEFLTHGLVAHFKNIEKDNQFKRLTPTIFLDNSIQSKKIRKQTLGQIFRILKQDERLSINEKLDKYLEKRFLLQRIQPNVRQYCKNASYNI